MSELINLEIEKFNYEPKKARHWILQFDQYGDSNFDSFLVLCTHRPSLTVIRNNDGSIKEKIYNDMEITFRDTVAPSSMQKVYEYATTRNTSCKAVLKLLAPNGDVVEKWNLRLGNVVSIYNTGKLDCDSLENLTVTALFKLLDAELEF